MACSNKLGLLARSFCSSVTPMVKPPLQMYGIGGRYATALYSAASKQKVLEVVEKDLTSFQAAVNKNIKLKEFILDPTIKRSIKAKILLDSSKDMKFSPATGFFLEQLAENGRLKKLDVVINAYKLIMAAHRGEIVCGVTSAKPLDANQSKELLAQLKKFVKPNETIKLTAKVDPTIIGGMIVSIGDNYVDMSVSSKVKKFTDLISTPV